MIGIAVRKGTSIMSESYRIGDPMRIKSVTLGALAFIVLVSRADAQFCIDADSETQDANDVAACGAATTTPYGALPAIFPANWSAATTRGLGFNLRFGSISEPNNTGRRNFGIGLQVGAGRAQIGLTGGVVDFTCDEEAGVECKSAFMVGASFASPLVASRMASGQQSFVVGLSGDVGFSSGDVFESTDFTIKQRSISVALGVPLALVARSGTIAITPFVEPSFFWGRTNFEVDSPFFSGDESENGTGFSLRGGVAFGLANGLGLHIGFSKAFVGEAKAMIGLGLSFQR